MNQPVPINVNEKETIKEMNPKESTINLIVDKPLPVTVDLKQIKEEKIEEKEIVITTVKEDETLVTDDKPTATDCNLYLIF